MVFEPEFKQKVYDALKDDSNIHTLMSLLESTTNDNYSKIRIIFESLLYKTELHLKPKILKDLGDMEVYNGAVRYYKIIQAVYTQLLDLINSELDKELITVVKRIS